MLPDNLHLQGSANDVTFDILVGSAVKNCGLSNTSVTSTVGGSFTLGSSWSVSAAVGINFGTFQLGGSFDYSEQISIQISQTFQIEVLPGQIGAMVATVSYAQIHGNMRVGST